MVSSEKARDKKIDSNAIGYDPRFEYSNNRTDSEVNNDFHMSYATDDIEDSHGFKNESPYSASVAFFLDNTPYEAIDSLNYISSTGLETIDLLKSYFSSTLKGYDDISPLMDAVANDNLDYIHKFAEISDKSITGSWVPGAISDIYDIVHDAEVIKSTMKELFFGTSDITDEDIQSEDTKYKEKIKEIDINCPEHLNYMALSNDASVCKLVNMYSSTVADSITDYEDIDYETVNDSKGFPQKLAESAYIDSYGRYAVDRNSLTVRMNDTWNGNNVVSGSMYNYYDSRRKLCALYDSMTPEMDETSPVISIINDYHKTLDKTIKNMARAFKGRADGLKKLYNDRKNMIYLKKAYGNNYSN